MIPREVKLEPGWLARQMREVRKETRDWPAVLRPLLTLNAELVRKPEQNGNG